MKGVCPICGELKGNLWDHLTRIHHMEGNRRKIWMDSAKIQNQPRPKAMHWSITSQDDKCESFHLKHPFTCMVSGMTGCGKTSWVKRLLEHKEETIQPVPQRIVWCYSRWQPSYADMTQSIPEIEFVRGIPANIENDDYFDIKIRNLIVIDDQMSSASNDKKVVNLFTQGSHHRNLSVIYLVQNVFHQGKGNRDISLNCHYLVIFKNPRDQLQILTLAKQMYPRNTQTFLQKYEEAVSRPFGYLFIDLKTTTPDHCRLRTNVLPGEIKQKDENEDVSKELMRFLNQSSTKQSPIQTKLYSLKEKMDDLLKDPSMSQDEKVRNYIQLQSMFLQYKKKLDNTSWLFPVHNTRNQVSSEPNIEEIEPELQQAIASVSTPQTNQLQTTANVTPELVPLPASPASTEPDLNAGPSQEPLFSPEILDVLTPPPTESRKPKRPRLMLKNYLDSDSHKTYGPYMSPSRVRRSRRLQRALDRY